MNFVLIKYRSEIYEILANSGFYHNIDIELYVEKKGIKKLVEKSSTKVSPDQIIHLKYRHYNEGLVQSLVQ